MLTPEPEPEILRWRHIFPAQEVAVRGVLQDATDALVKGADGKSIDWSTLSLNITLSQEEFATDHLELRARAVVR